ncbi:3'(2'),5'-bisphosphate nucleotidase CysQ [Notoacmeibacter marinus]|uniref:3'(2'),5'-bisphosphate nucleotidase CysQ n=1 Tax=Notoacmeibacter marinus TaxID=1876515 RepID=UPI000DF2F721|nr:3'(2'),5'-bisphosphate nucleotidase CysQ [Notoacmeibacter marinus]
MQSQAVLEIFERLALEAGRAILAIRARGIEVERKTDDSPVTEADRTAEAVILKGLADELADIPVVAEEEVAAGRRPDISGGRFVLVDALDGTREFIKGNDDFTVNIALIEDGVPTVGVVLAPARQQIWAGSPAGAISARAIMQQGAIDGRHPIASQRPATPLRVVASVSHRTPQTDRFIASCPKAQTVSVGSSLKFCLLAEGEADLYPRFGRTMEWDTAAGDAVLRAAGGLTRKPDGQAFVYGKTDQADDADFANGPFICAGNEELLERVLAEGACESIPVSKQISSGGSANS